MKKFNYGKEVDPKLIDLIVSRARLLGIRGDDIEDALQQVLLVILRFRFDPAKSNGCKETTVLTTIIDRRLMKIRRTEARYKAKIEKVKGGEKLESDTRMQLAVEVRSAVTSLSPIEQKVCEALGKGESTSQIAKDLGCSWHTVESIVAKIRERFTKLGLDRWTGE
jgi:DNA-directed RNA polymerase specialized sigma24 family protein